MHIGIDAALAPDLAGLLHRSRHATGMVPMAMRENDIGNGTKVHAQDSGIPHERLALASGIE